MRTVIEADRVLDGTGAAHEKAAVLIEGERIAGIAPQAEMGRPEGAKAIGESESLGGLTRLDLQQTGLGDRGIEQDRKSVV